MEVGWSEHRRHDARVCVRCTIIHARWKRQQTALRPRSLSRTTIAISDVTDHTGDGINMTRVPREDKRVSATLGGRRADHNKRKQTQTIGGREGGGRQFRILRRRGLRSRPGRKARESYVPYPDHQWRRMLCVGRRDPPALSVNAMRGSLLTYDRLLGHGLLRRPFRPFRPFSPPLADLFRHLLLRRRWPEL